MTTAILCKKRFSYLRELANITNSDLIALSRVKEPDLSKYDIVFNWGVMHSKGINSPEAIRRVSNKASMRLIWLENDLSITPFLSRLQMNETDIYVARPERHQGGEKFLIGTKKKIDPLLESIRPYYISQHIDKDREFRFHVMDNAILFAQEKYHKDGKKIIGNWNHTNGYLFRHMRWSEIKPKLAKLAVEAVKVSGLFFGAVDVMQKDNDYYLLEINTAPRLEQYSIELYANAINYYKEHGELTKSKIKQLFTYRGEDENS